MFNSLGIKDNDILEKALGQVSPGLVRLDLLISLLETIGFKDDMPAKSKHMDYSILTLQSIRILNRLATHVKAPKSEKDVQALLLPVIKLLPVATKRQTQQVQIIDAPDFFGLLKKL